MPQPLSTPTELYIHDTPVRLQQTCSSSQPFSSVSLFAFCCQRRKSSCLSGNQALLNNLGQCRSHIISNHSQRVAAFGNQLDYLGVVLLMWGSTIPTVYYGFYCDPRLQKLYWTMVGTHPPLLIDRHISGEHFANFCPIDLGTRNSLCSNYAQSQIPPS